MAAWDRALIQAYIELDAAYRREQHGTQVAVSVVDVDRQETELVHYANPRRLDWPACTTSVYDVPLTSHDQDVTCSACRAWLAHED